MTLGGMYVRISRGRTFKHGVTPLVIGYWPIPLYFGIGGKGPNLVETSDWMKVSRRPSTTSMVDTWNSDLNVIRRRFHQGLLGAEEYKYENTLRERNSHPICPTERKLVIIYRFHAPTVKVLIYCFLTLKTERLSDKKKVQHAKSFRSKDRPLTPLGDRLSVVPWFRESGSWTYVDLRLVLVTDSHLHLGRVRPENLLGPSYGTNVGTLSGTSSPESIQHGPKDCVSLTLYYFHITKIYGSKPR